jgi:uncharacterized protein
MTLTRTERLILSNQLLILEKLDPKNKAHYREQRVAIEHGYTAHYSRVFRNVHQNELPEDECNYVIAVLDMHLALHDSYKKLSAADKKSVDRKRLRFEGFDANLETEYLWYSDFLSQFGKWKELVPRGGINSHHPTRDRYKRMLTAWNEIPQEEKWKMSKEQILRVLG